MYITAKELIKQYGVRYTDAEDMTLEDVKNALSEKAEEYGLAVSFLNEEVTYGLFGGKKDCLVLMHPTFKMEYYMYAIMLAPQGKTLGAGHCTPVAYIFEPLCYFRKNLYNLSQHLLTSAENVAILSE